MVTGSGSHLDGPQAGWHLQGHTNTGSAVGLDGRKLGSTGTQRGYHRSREQARDIGGGRAGQTDHRPTQLNRSCTSERGVKSSEHIPWAGAWVGWEAGARSGQALVPPSGLWPFKSAAVGQRGSWIWK